MFPRRRRPCRTGRARAVTGTALAGLLLLTTAGPALAAGTPAPRAPATTKPVPGMGAALPCSPSVLYSVDGRPPVPRPLPAPVSRLGGERLAQPGLQVTAGATTPPPAPKATAWLVADAGTGRVLAACNAHVPLAPASTLKLLTALTLVHTLDAGARYVARPEDMSVDGTRVGLVTGSVYTTADLWHALLMSSANDAATALAAMSGGTPAATAAMAATARSLGAADTVPRNTSGLDEPGQVSSAYDLAIFGRAALADATIMKYSRTRSYAFPEAGTALGGTRKSFQIQNHDKLLYNYPGALGIKNGWTSTTGGSFVGAAQRGGRRLVVTVLAADPQTWRMCAALLDWGFAATAAADEGVGELAPGPVPEGANADAAAAAGASSRAGTGITAAQGALPPAGPASGARPGRTGPGGFTVGVLAAMALIWAVALGARGVRSLRRRRAGLGPAADDGWQRRRPY